MKVSGKTIVRMVTEDSYTQMVTFMKGSGIWTRHKELVNTYTAMEPSTVVIGSQISNRAMEWKHGLTVHTTRDNTGTQ